MESRESIDPVENLRMSQDMSPLSLSKLTIYGNVLINDIARFNTLQATLPQWLDYWDAPCVLRVRGELSGVVMDFCKSLKSVTCVQGSDFLQWRKQAFCDISSITSKFVMIYLEDHLPSKSAPLAKSLLSELTTHRVVVFQYSWFFQYQGLRKILIEYNSDEDEIGIYTELDSETLSRILKRDTNYFVSLTSIFDRDFLLRILNSSRPFLRKYDPRAPFDVEQGPQSSWYLPMVFGISKNELGICIDDDNAAPGSSAIARGLFAGPQVERGVSHQANLSINSLSLKVIRRLVGGRGLSSMNATLKLRISRFLFWLNVLAYSLEAPILRCLDWLRLRKLKKDRSNHPHCPRSKDI